MVEAGVSDPDTSELRAPSTSSGNRSTFCLALVVDLKQSVLRSRSPGLLRLPVQVIASDPYVTVCRHQCVAARQIVRLSSG